MMIKKLFRQHSTTVLTIPKPILQAMDLKAGDYVELEVWNCDQEIRIRKIEGKIGHERKNGDGKSEHDRGGKA